jgi:hypothetical protein
MKAEEQEIKVVMAFLALASFYAQGSKAKTEVKGIWLVLKGEAASYREQFTNHRILRDQRAVYGTKNLPSCRPGSIYGFTQGKEEGSVLPSSASYVGRIDNIFADLSDEVIQLQAEYDAFKAAQNAKKYEKSETMADLPWEALKPFRMAFCRMSGPQKSALLIQIIDKVRDG